MKKIIFSIFALALVVLGLASCGEPSYSEDVLADNTKQITYHVSNAHYNNWSGFNVEGQKPEDSQMKAVSLADVAKVNKDLAAALAKHSIKYLYMFEGFEAGTDAVWAGWTNPCSTDGNKTATELDGSYAVKAIKVKTSEVEGETVRTATAWMPDTDDKFHAESLTPETLWITPNYKADQDEKGFHWNMNPYLIKGAGKYTIVLAIYNGEALAGGFGAVKTQDLTEHVEVEPEVKAWGIAGTMNGWGDPADTDMVKNETTGLFEAQITVEAGALFKVRANDKWTESYGVDGENVEIEAAGTYKITFNEETHEINVIPAN